jgi:tetratricopeptide (TPR) repeat protein
MIAMETKLIEILENRNVQTLIDFLFNYDGNVKYGLRLENNLLDFKREMPPNDDKIGWAEIAKDVLGFYNNAGGFLVFGVDDSFNVVGIDEAMRLDSKIFNDKIRHYLGDKIWVEYQSFNLKAKVLGVALIPKNSGRFHLFQNNSPEYKKGKLIFYKGGAAVRSNDSTRVLKTDDVLSYDDSQKLSSLEKYEINIPFFRILTKDYTNFIFRKQYCEEIIKGLQHNRCAVVSVIGIGGIGKTALATWAVLECYKRKVFDFIVSVTAKDRELTSKGISALFCEVSNLDDLLDSVCEVLGFSDLKKLDFENKKSTVGQLLKDSNGLLFVDNVETIKDIEFIDFLNNVPEGIKVLVTSRRNVVRVSNYPIEVKKMEQDEINSYLSSLANQERLKYIYELHETDKIQIGSATDGIPLIIKWLVARSHTIIEVMQKTKDLSESFSEGAEILEFSFRRIFEEMNDIEISLVKTLALFPNIPIEALVKGSSKSESLIFEAIENLEQDTIIYSSFDEELKDYVYYISHFVRLFINQQVMTIEEEKEITRRMQIWYEALDISNKEERIIVRETRQGIKNPGNSLVLLAESASNRGDLESANSLFLKAINRDPKNPRVFWRFAEFVRHRKEKAKDALRYYESAKTYIENGDLSSVEKSLVLREYGLMMRQSGERKASEKSIELLRKSLELSPNDSITVCALAKLFKEKGNYKTAINILLPLYENNNSWSSLEYIVPLLSECYSMSGDKLRSLEVKSKLDKFMY